MASRPSVSAAGPGCRISGDLISKIRFAVTAGDLIPAGAGPNAIRHDLFAAPGGEDHVRAGRRDGVRRDDPVLGRGTRAKMAADVVAAGDLDQLGNPADPGDQRLVPLLEEDARAGPSMLLLTRDRLEAPSQGVRQRIGGIAAIDERPKGADHREDAGHVTLVEQMDGKAGACEILDDSGLEIGESEDEIGRFSGSSRLSLPMTRIFSR
jgi:hypothetical protein